MVSLSFLDPEFLVKNKIWISEVVLCFVKEYETYSPTVIDRIGSPWIFYMETLIESGANMSSRNW